MPVETTFPPDITFLLHDLLLDAEEVKPGESKAVRIIIPSTDSAWNAHLPLLSSGRFCIIWSKNSLQYGGDGVNISFSYDSVPEGMLLIIEDNGPGVKPECKERIFMRNYADRRGYGLYLAAEILDITGVKISETGVFGEGARFELIFPPDTFRLEN